MDQSLSYKHCQQNNRKRGLNVAITRNAVTQNLATKGRKCDDTHQHCSNTNGCFYPRKPVVSKQPTCVESKRKVNGNCERLAPWWPAPPPITHRPSTANTPQRRGPTSSPKVGPRRPQDSRVSRARRTGTAERASRCPTSRRRRGPARLRGPRSRDRRPWRGW